MTGLTTIENDLYASLISLILTKVDDTYQEFHWQLYHESRIGFYPQREDYYSFQSNSIIDYLVL